VGGIFGRVKLDNAVLFFLLGAIFVIGALIVLAGLGLLLVLFVRFLESLNE
jgi:hypothetical protein